MLYLAKIYEMKTINQLFAESVALFGENVFLWEKKQGYYTSTTYNETQKLVYQLAAGLINAGIEKGDRIALLSEGRNEWAIGELAILHAGAVNVPLSVKLDELSELKFRLEHSGCKMVMVSQFHVEKIRKIKSELPQLETIILFDQAEKFDNNEIWVEELCQSGKKYLEENKEAFDARWKSIQGNDFANISYTSGTTADPKGIILTHRNYTANVEQAATLMKIPPHYVTLLILPWDHSFGHTAGIYSFMFKGASIASVERGNTPAAALKNIPINIKEIKPHVLMSVPALAKNFKKNIEKGIRDKGKLTELLFKLALKIAYAYNNDGFNKGKGIQALNKPLVSLFDKILFSKIRQGFGGNLRLFIGGGALLDIEIQRFFYAIGIPMMQGYGLSEASPIISSNAVIKHKLGSSGFLVDPLELKICDNEGNALPVGEKGEIVIKGENVMRGYWKNEKSTAEVIKDSWFYTGDMGYMDTDGFLYVMGRFKSLLIANDGEKYSPEGIEEALINQSSLIDQCMLYNNQSAYTVGLVVPSKEALRLELFHLNIQSTTPEGNEMALKLIQKEIDQYKDGGKHAGMFPSRWIPTAIAVLDEDFNEKNHLLNSTMKLVRGKVVEYHKARIDYLFESEAKNIINEKNKSSIKKLLY